MNNRIHFMKDRINIRKMGIAWQVCYQCFAIIGAIVGIMVTLDMIGKKPFNIPTLYILYGGVLFCFSFWVLLIATLWNFYLAKRKSEDE